MTKKNLKLRFYATLSLLIALVLVGGVLAVRAYSNSSASQPAAVIENAGSVVVNQAPQVANQAQTSDQTDQTLGASTGPFQTTPLQCVNNECTYYATGSFIDASTTIVSIVDPFLTPTSTGDVGSVVVRTDTYIAAGTTTVSIGTKWTGVTTTVDLARLNITTGATSSFKLACGAYSAPVGALPLTRTIVSTTPALAGDSIATSSVGIIENNVSVAQGAMYGVGSTAKIMLGHDAPYFVCVVSAVADTAFTNPANVFAGTFSVKFHKQ